MLAEGKPKSHRRRTEGDCGAPVARFGVWVGPFQLCTIRDQLNLPLVKLVLTHPPTPESVKIITVFSNITGEI